MKSDPKPEPKNPTARFELSACNFEGQNFVYKAPPGLEGCADLPVYRGDGVAVSCWKLSLRQRLRLLFTGRLFLWVMMNGHPPVCLTTLNPLRNTPKKGGAS